MKCFKNKANIPKKNSYLKAESSSDSTEMSQIIFTILSFTLETNLKHTEI